MNRPYRVNGIKGSWATFEAAQAAAERVFKQIAKHSRLWQHQRAWIFRKDAHGVLHQTLLTVAADGSTSIDRSMSLWQPAPEEFEHYYSLLSVARKVATGYERGMDELRVILEVIDNHIAEG